MDIKDFEEMVTQRGYTFHWHTERRFSRDFDKDTAFIIDIIKGDKTIAQYASTTITFLPINRMTADLDSLKVK